jgi:CheY-like chemotaxis protein
MSINSNAGSKVPQVLLVEDNEDAVLLTREAFDACDVRVHLEHVNNGEKCLQYLRKQGIYANASPPDFILLDINMPMMDGSEVLTEMVKDEKLRHFPVIVLTTSSNAEDIMKMYRLRCNSYITKRIDFSKFVQDMDQLARYWLTVVDLPGKAH